MARSRPYRSPDGLDWRDPAMPVLRFVTDTMQIEPFSPDEAAAYHRFIVDRTDEPGYRQDPTYNLRRKPNGPART